MKIGIYNANLHTMGGGEKHIGVVAEFLSKNHEVEFICSEDVDKDMLCNKLNLDLSSVTIRPMGLEHDHEKYSEISAEYDFFINCTYLSTLKSQCKKSAMLIWFPRIWNRKFPAWVKYFTYNILNKTLFRFTNDTGIHFINRFYQSQHNFVLDREYISTYDMFIANSRYTQKWIKKEFGVDSEILYPPIDVDEFLPGKKENIILSVGRFFVHSHNKKQLEMIQIFKELYDNNPEAKKYEYHLCGSVHHDELSAEYLKRCEEEAKGYPIFIHENIAFPDLKDIYSKAKIFWHASGFGENPRKFPDRFEHFGMTTVESMAAGAVPVVIAQGGQVEIVEDGKNGFLWNSKSELINKTAKLIANEELVRDLSKKAILSSKKYSKANMHLQLKSILLKLNINL